MTRRPFTTASAALAMVQGNRHLPASWPLVGVAEVDAMELVVHKNNACAGGGHSPIREGRRYNHSDNALRV
jgi:hypothetical protein